MTFDEWAKENCMYIDVKENARAIWYAAQLAERVECAKECGKLDMESFGIYPLRAMMVSSACIDAILSRSSIEDKKQISYNHSEFPRSDPSKLSTFDPRTKVCTMNCGSAMGDTRSDAESKYQCGDCLTVET